MTHALALIFMPVVSAACPPVGPDTAPKVAASGAAISAAKIAWREKFSDNAVRRWEPYRASLRDGSWHAFGTPPNGARGSTPQAAICAGNSKVLQVTHGR